MRFMLADDVVARVLAGDELITGTDANGTYVRADALEIDYPGQKIWVVSNGKRLLELPVPALSPDNVLHISEIELRVRIMVSL